MSTRSAAVEKREDWWERIRKKRRVGSLGSMHDEWSQERIWEERDCYCGGGGV